jgi:small GTP-binding protein
MIDILSKAFQKLFSNNKIIKILLVGLDAVGKSTIYYKLRHDETFKTPIKETLNKNIDITIFDLGRHEAIRKMFDHYIENTDVIIYVIDSGNIDRMEESCNELHRLLKDKMLGKVPILFLANKQDLNEALSVSEITKIMKLECIEDRVWNIQATSALDGNGLLDGLSWIAKILKTN